MLALVLVSAALLAVVSCGSALLAVAAAATRSLTLNGATAVRGDLLTVHRDSGGEEVVVVRRVLRDITRQHVVLVRPWHWWHRRRWTRRWL